MSDESAGLTLLQKILATLLTANTALVGYGVQQLHSLETQLAVLKAQMAQQPPPAWLMDRLVRLEQEVIELERLLRRK